MTRHAFILMAGLLAVHRDASAETSQVSSFPIRQELGVLSMNGWPVAGKAPTLFVTTRGDGFGGYGSTGCNSWSASVTFSEPDQIAVGGAKVTGIGCPLTVLQAERTFLEAIARPLRWRREHGRLVLENDGNKLMLAPVFQQR